MKKTLLAFGILSTVFAFQYADSHHATIVSFHQMEQLNTNGGITSQTGAPGDQNCTGCHGGSVQDGNNGINALSIVGGTDNNFDAGEVLRMNLTLANATSKNGFQLVVLNENNQMAGSFSLTDNQRTQIRQNNASGRSYVTHTSTGTASSSWEFEWITPEQAGNYTFYVATNRSNANNGSGGDIIHLSNHTFTGVADEDPGDNTANIIENKEDEFAFDAFYESENSRFTINFQSLNASNIFFNVLDLSGKSVHSQNLGNYTSGTYSEKINLRQPLQSGIYIVTVFIDNQPSTKKIYVN